MSDISEHYLDAFKVGPTTEAGVSLAYFDHAMLDGQHPTIDSYIVTPVRTRLMHELGEQTCKSLILDLKDTSLDGLGLGILPAMTRLALRHRKSFAVRDPEEPLLKRMNIMRMTPYVSVIFSIDRELQNIVDNQN